MEAIITESQLQRLIGQVSGQGIITEEEFQSASLIYENFSSDEKLLFRDMLMAYYPDKFNKLNEETHWWNTLGDVLGFVDPTGAVDIINGISYFMQGEKFYGFLSLLAAIPFADFIVKPIMGLGKSSKIFKGMESALKFVKTNPAKAVSELSNISKQNKLVGSLVNGVSKWGKSFASMLDKLPGKWLGLKQVLKDWLNVFVKAAEKNKQMYRVVGQLASKAKANPAEIRKIMDIIAGQSFWGKNRFILSKGGLQAAKDQGVWKTIMGGVPRLWGNRERRSLMNRTKLYAGFLDSLGITSFKSADDLANEMGEDNFNEKMNQYANSPQGQENLYNDLTSAPPTGEEGGSHEPEPEKTKKSSESSDFLNDLLMGTLTRLAL